MKYIETNARALIKRLWYKMTKKHWLVDNLNDKGYGYTTFHGCVSLTTSQAQFPSYEEAEKSARKRAGGNIKDSFGVYELVSIVEAPAPEVEVTKV